MVSLPVPFFDVLKSLSFHTEVKPPENGTVSAISIKVSKKEIGPMAIHARHIPIAKKA